MNFLSVIRNKINAKRFEKCEIMYAVCKFRYDYALRIVHWTGKYDKDGFPLVMKRRMNGSYYVCPIYRAAEPDGDVITWCANRQLAEQTVDTFIHR